MSANAFGSLFRVTTFGESHGPALGAVVEGCPSGVPWDEALLLRELERRRPGHGRVGASARSESDRPQVLSGVFEGRTLGTPIALVVQNQDARPADYAVALQSPRVGHADDLWKEKFSHVDARGGGRASGRETVARVMAGAVAQMFLRTQMPDLKIRSTIQKIGPQECSCPADALSDEMRLWLAQAQEKGESYGAQVELVVSGVAAGLGQPVFHKLKADLATAVMGVGATHAIEWGLGSDAALQAGSVFHSEALGSEAQRYGGIRGGISTGEEISMQVFFKPTSSWGERAQKGRHDACIALRAVSVLEAMIYLVLADHALWRRLDRVVS